MAFCATTVWGGRRCRPLPGPGSGSARPVEWPGSRPLTLEPEIGPDFGGLSEWPLAHVVKVLCFYHPDDTAEMKAPNRRRW